MRSTCTFPRSGFTRRLIRHEVSDSIAERLALFREPNFASLWVAGACWNTIQWLEMLAVGFFVFEQTGSAFLVALMAVLRILPFAIFGVFVGSMAPRFDRRRVIGWSLLFMVPVSLLLGFLAQLDHVEIWHIALATFVSGSVWSLDMPVRRPLMGEIVDEERVGTAMGLDALSYNASHMLGPVAGGLLLSVLGLGGAYFLSAVFYVIAVIAMLMMTHRDKVSDGKGRSVLREITEGFRYLRTSRAMAAIMGITVVFNLWAYPMVTMVPVMGKDVLDLDAFPVGLLASAEGAGAFFGTVALALWARTVDFRRLFLVGTGVYTLAVLLFGWSSWVWLSALFLTAAGLAGAAFGVMQSALVLLNAPPGTARSHDGSAVSVYWSRPDRVSSHRLAGRLAGGGRSGDAGRRRRSGGIRRVLVDLAGAQR